VVTLAVAVLLAAVCGGSATPPATQPTALAWRSVQAPAGFGVAGARWLRLTGAGGLSASQQLAAVLSPAGRGPFPTVLYLHGSVGLNLAQIEWTRRLVAAGFLVVAGCWSDGGGLQAVPCPEAVASGFDSVSALIAMARAQHEVDGRRLALYGISAGGIEAYDVLSRRHDVRAAVVDSGESYAAVSAITARVLILGGTADTTIPVASQQATEEKLHAAGKAVESHYYDGGRHVVIEDPRFQDDATSRVVEFFRRTL
jgi:carboxymethylenebutenolidase